MTLNISKPRLDQIQILTDLFLSKDRFSFLRLGDGELSALLKHQKGDSPTKLKYSDYDQMRLLPQDYDRLLKSYELCDFLDTCEIDSFNSDRFRELELCMSPHQLRCNSKSTTQILRSWAAIDLDKLLQNRTCALFSAESLLLRNLQQDSRYLDCASEFFPNIERLMFLEIPGSGFEYWKKIDQILNYITAQIKKNGIDVVFLSLGPVAKILCNELRRTMDVVAIDFGAISRGLCFSATTGISTALSSHSPFYFEVPQAVFSDALEASFPEMTAIDICRKMNRQLIFHIANNVPSSSLSLRFPSEGTFVLDDDGMNRIRSELSILERYYSNFSHSIGDLAILDLVNLLEKLKLIQYLPNKYKLLNLNYKIKNRIPFSKYYRNKYSFFL